MIFMESPTNRIKEVLIEKGIKQTWLAEKLGKSFTIVNSYVCNRRQPSLELLFCSNILTGLPIGTTLLIVSAREEYINSLKMLF